MENEFLYSKEDFYIMLLRRGILLAFLIIAIFLIRFSFADISPILLWVLVFWLLTTVPFDLFLRNIKNRKAFENANFYYFLLEFLFMTIGIHYIGGITWYGGVFYCFTIIFCHFVLPRKKAIEATLIANFLLFDGLVALEFFKVIPHRVVFGLKFHNNPEYVLSTMLVINFSLMFLAGVLGLFANLLKEKKVKVEAASQKIDEEKTVLEIQVRARTREAEEIMRNLGTLVEERTKSLNARVKELEKFTKLTKGREERLISLEKEAERLKFLLKMKNQKS